MSTNYYVQQLSRGIAFTGKTFKHLLKIIRFHEALAMSALFFIFFAGCASQSREIPYRHSTARKQPVQKQAAETATEKKPATETATAKYQVAQTTTVKMPAAETATTTNQAARPELAVPTANGEYKQKKLELVILEDMPDLGGIKLDKILGTDYDGRKYFYQRYTTFQRRIRDALLKQAEKHGYVIHLLEDNSLYDHYKSKNGTLVGVYFDPDYGFRIDRRLLNAIKANNPNTMALQYRIDSLIFVPDTMEYRISISLNLKDLKSNITRPVGTLSSKQKASSQNQEVVMDELASFAENVINTLMDKENAGAKLDIVAEAINRSAASMPKSPITLNLNATYFDPAIRRRFMYKLRSELVKNGLTTRDHVSTSETTLTAEILASKCNDSEELYFEYISPILEEQGIFLDDDKVHHDNRNILIIQLDSRPSESQLPSAARTDAKKLRVAVLYFENNTGKDENAQLSKGLCDMMIHDMKQTQEVEVIERPHLEKLIKELKMSEEEAFDPSKSAQIGKMLGVQYLVFGSYFQMFTKFRIDARLVRVETGKICVTSGIMGKAEEFDTIEKQIVAELLNGLLEKKAVNAQPTAESAKLSTEAVVKYGQALSLIDKGQTAEAREILQKLVKENPGYTEAEKTLQNL